MEFYEDDLFGSGYYAREKISELQHMLQNNPIGTTLSMGHPTQNKLTMSESRSLFIITLSISIIANWGRLLKSASVCEH